MSVEGSGDRARRDRLVGDLRERVLKFMGDPAVLLDPRVPGLARDLAEIITRSSQAGAAPDVEAMHVLAAVHWYRYHVLPKGQDQDDLQAALSWYGELLQAAPDLFDLLMTTDLLARAERESSKDKLRRYPRMSRDGARCATAVQVLLEAAAPACQVGLIDPRPLVPSKAEADPSRTRQEAAPDISLGCTASV